jgi:hypothetical protein
MKGWFGLALMGCIVVGLLLSLGPPAGRIGPLAEDHFGTCPQREPASSFLHAWAVDRPAFPDPIPSRKESIPGQGMWAARAPSPPRRDSHGPPAPTQGPDHGWAKRPTQSNNISHPPWDFSVVPYRQNIKSGFCNSL